MWIGNGEGLECAGKRECERKVKRLVCSCLRRYTVCLSISTPRADAFLPFFYNLPSLCILAPLRYQSTSVHSPCAHSAANCTHDDISTVRSCPTCKSRKPRIILLPHLLIVRKTTSLDSAVAVPGNLLKTHSYNFTVICKFENL